MHEQLDAGSVLSGCAADGPERAACVRRYILGERAVLHLHRAVEREVMPRRGARFRIDTVDLHATDVGRDEIGGIELSGGLVVGEVLEISRDRRGEYVVMDAIASL